MQLIIFLLICSGSTGMLEIPWGGRIEFRRATVEESYGRTGAVVNFVEDGDWTGWSGKTVLPARAGAKDV